MNLLRLTVLLILFKVNFLFSSVSLPAILSDGMVLQCHASVPIWGWGNSGDIVRVSFNHQVIVGKVKTDGSWRVNLKPLEPSATERTMVITVGNNTTKIHHVVVGEVWLAAGQSNMRTHLDEMSRKTLDKKDQPIANYIKKELTSHFDPLIRQIKVPTATSYNKEQNNLEANWVKADSHLNKIPFSAVGYYFAKELKSKLNVPIGIIVSAWGAKKIQPFIPSTQYEKDKEFSNYYKEQILKMEKQIASYDSIKEKEKYNAILVNWRKRVKEAEAKGKWPPSQPKQYFPQNNPNFPSTIYNAMIHPLIPYAIKGAIWYQGESNTNDLKTEVFSYDRYLHNLIDGLRDRWGQGDFPFYYCQLAQFKAPTKNPINSNNWVSVCNDMRKALDYKNVGMAVLNDCGEVRDIHPRNKVDPGKRLALWALAKTYGYKDIIYSGPLYKSHLIEGNKVNIIFDSVGEGLMTARKHLLNPAKPLDEELKGFQICGQDKKWKWAKAVIKNKNSVEVWHPEINQPYEVRYAWATNPAWANLYNKSGLPTSVFSTR